MNEHRYPAKIAPVDMLWKLNENPTSNLASNIITPENRSITSVIIDNHLEINNS
jgi:hypothetical protein